MWCADCQQDVPAVARAVNEPLVCPRCQSELHAGHTTPSDVGIGLESFGQTEEVDLSPPVGWLNDTQTQDRLHAIDRKLSSPYRIDASRGWSPIMHNARAEMSAPPESVPLRSVTRRAAAEPAAGRRPTRTSWLLSLLLCCGLIGFLSGAGILAWSAAFELSWLWQQGLALTIGAEGMLILSLTWMAARLWRNGRRVNRQLHGVDQQLTEMQQLTGTISGGQRSSSQHYYHHFAQAASPHFLVANLQGQVDQLAARMASEG